MVVEAIGHQIGSLRHALDAVAFGGQVYYFGALRRPDLPDQHAGDVPQEPHAPQRPDHRQEGAPCGKAGKYLLAHDELRSTYVSDVYPVGHVQQAFEAATAPKPGQFKIALDMRADAA